MTPYIFIPLVDDVIHDFIVASILLEIFLKTVERLGAVGGFIPAIGIERIRASELRALGRLLQPARRLWRFPVQNAPIARVLLFLDVDDAGAGYAFRRPPELALFQPTLLVVQVLRALGKPKLGAPGRPATRDLRPELGELALLGRLDDINAVEAVGEGLGWILSPAPGKVDVRGAAPLAQLETPIWSGSPTIRLEELKVLRGLGGVAGAKVEVAAAPAKKAFFH